MESANSSEVYIRPATVDDASAMGRMRAKMFLANGWTDEAGARSLARLQASYLSEAMSSGDGFGLIADTGDDPVGCIAGVIIKSQPSPRNVTGRIGHIINLYVEETYRRQGIARALTEGIIERLRDEGVIMFQLWASDDARSLYESIGFESSNEMRLWPPSM